MLLVAFFGITLVYQVTKLTQLLQNRGALLSAIRLGGILSERCCQCICIPCLEENKVCRLVAAAVFLQGIVHTVLSGNSLKILDVLIGNLDIGNTLILTNQFLHGLLAAGLHGTGTDLLQTALLVVGKVLLDSVFEDIGCKLAAVDDEGYCPLFNFFLYRRFLLSSGLLSRLLGPVNHKYDGQHLFVDGFRTGGNHRIIVQRKGCTLGDAPTTGQSQRLGRTVTDTLRAIDGEADDLGVNLSVCHVGGVRNDRPAICGLQGNAGDANNIRGVVDDDSGACGIHLAALGNCKTESGGDRDGEAGHQIVTAVTVVILVTVCMGSSFLHGIAARAAVRALMVLLGNARPCRVSDAVGCHLNGGVTTGTTLGALVLRGRFGSPCTIGEAVCNRLDSRIAAGAAVGSGVLGIIHALPSGTGDGVVLHLGLAVRTGATGMGTAVLRCRGVFPCSSCDRMVAVLIGTVSAGTGLGSAVLGIIVACPGTVGQTVVCLLNSTVLASSTGVRPLVLGIGAGCPFGTGDRVGCHFSC